MKSQFTFLNEILSLSLALDEILRMNERGLLVMPACHTYHTLRGSLTRSLDLSLVGRNHIPSSDYVNQLSLIQFGTVNRSH